VVHRLNRRGTPIVLVARTPLSGVDSVNAENNASGALLGEHLVSAGARTILFVGDPEATADVTERFAAIAAAAERDGARVTVEPVSEFSEEAGVHAARQALARRRTTKSLPDAFACANDELALGLMLGLRDAGLRVPEDAIVSGWDDVMAARYAGLTTVRQPMRDLGAHAAQLLDQLIHRTRETPVHEVLPTELIVRQSTQQGTTPTAGGTTR
jgi:LacI family transcriptional regulator